MLLRSTWRLAVGSVNFVQSACYHGYTRAVNLNASPTSSYCSAIKQGYEKLDFHKRTVF